MEQSPSHAAIVKALESAKLLQALTSDERNRLASVSRFHRVPRKGVIWLGSSHLEFFGIVHSGFVKMTRTKSGGQEVTMELMGPGQAFGLNAIVSSKACPLSAVAVTEVIYIRVPAEPFLTVHASNVSFRDGLLQRSLERLHQKIDLFAKLSHGKVDERIASVVLLLAEGYGKRHAGGIEIQVPLTRQELGELAATTTETTIRTLSRWQRDSILATDHQTLTILNEQALIRLVSD